MTRSRPNGSPSCIARLMYRLIFRMPLRVLMPASVTKPIMLATESGCPAIQSAATLPISASGTLPMMISASTGDRYRLCSTMKISASEIEREDADAKRCLLLGLIAALEPGGVALRPRRLGHDAAQVGDDLRKVAAAVAVGIDGDPALAVLAEDLVGSLGLLDPGDHAKRYEPGGRGDQKIAQARSSSDPNPTGG